MGDSEHGRDDNEVAADLDRRLFDVSEMTRLHLDQLAAEQGRRRRRRRTPAKLDGAAVGQLALWAADILLPPDEFYEAEFESAPE